MKLAIERGQIPTSQDAVLTVKAYFRYINADETKRLEMLFARREDFLASLTSEPFYAILGFARESQLRPAVEQVVRAPTLLAALDVSSKKFRGLQGMIGSLEDVLQERVPLGEVYDLAMDFKGNTAGFVGMLDRALERAKAVEAGKQEESGVKLLTYFKSKGLQWHTVILTTCNEGVIPHKNAPIEDERRLFYVAMTRSSANLVISYVKSVCGTKVAPSRFLKEAGLI
jgi:DNA helicase-2/ATP-dependent DNA helicase PcrA